MEEGSEVRECVIDLKKEAGRVMGVWVGWGLGGC